MIDWRDDDGGTIVAANKLRDGGKGWAVDLAFAQLRADSVVWKITKDVFLRRVDVILESPAWDFASADKSTKILNAYIMKRQNPGDLGITAKKIRDMQHLQFARQDGFVIADNGELVPLNVKAEEKPGRFVGYSGEFNIPEPKEKTADQRYAADWLAYHRKLGDIPATQFPIEMNDKGEIIKIRVPDAFEVISKHPVWQDGIKGANLDETFRASDARMAEADGPTEKAVADADAVIKGSRYLPTSKVKEVRDAMDKTLTDRSVVGGIGRASNNQGRPF